MNIYNEKYVWILLCIIIIGYNWIIDIYVWNIIKDIVYWLFKGLNYFWYEMLVIFKLGFLKVDFGIVGEFLWW